jgi:hypothetical protein
MQNNLLSFRTLSIFSALSLLATQILLTPNCFASKYELQNLKKFFTDHKIKSTTIHKKVLKEKVVSSCDMRSSNKTQGLSFYLAALHKKPCKKAFKKLKQYENYKDHIGIIEKSNYNSKRGEAFFLIDSPLIPRKMVVKFKLPRIKDVGTYPYTFDHGIFKDLHGDIILSNYKNRCLFYSTAKWDGPSTKIPDFILRIFIETATRMTIQKLFRISAN